MMRHNAYRRVGLLMMAALMLAGSGGCAMNLLVGQGLSFGAGWIIGALTGPRVTETTCYRNGILIDCASLADPAGGLE